jgi:ethanolamine utilization protein
MDLNNLNSIIEEITKEVIRRLEEKVKNPLSSSLPSVIVPLSYNSVTWEKSCAEIRELSVCHSFRTVLVADGHELDIVEKQFDKSSVEFYMSNQVNRISPDLFTDVKLVLAPLFSPYNLGRVANITPLTIVEWIVLEALQRGIKIVIARDGFCPGSLLRKSSGLTEGPSAFNDLLRNHADRLSSWGIKFIDLSSIRKSVESEFKADEKLSVPVERKGKEVITKDDILKFSLSGNRVMEVSCGSIITPLARDIAKEKNIEIKFRV